MVKKIVQMGLWSECNKNGVYGHESRGDLSKLEEVAQKHMLKKQQGSQNPVSLQVRVACRFQIACKEMALPYHLEYISSWTGLMAPQRTTPCNYSPSAQGIAF